DEDSEYYFVPSGVDRYHSSHEGGRDGSERKGEKEFPSEMLCFGKLRKGNNRNRDIHHQSSGSNKFGRDVPQDKYGEIRTGPSVSHAGIEKGDGQYDHTG